MTVLTTEVVVRRTERNARRELYQFLGKHSDLSGENFGRVALLPGDSKTLVATKLLCMYFPKPTVIQLTIGEAVSTIEIAGNMLIPGSCAITVANDSGTTTDPLIFNYVVA